MDSPLPWWKKDWFFYTATVVVTLCLAWGMAYFELVRRAKHAYLEGEKYYSWVQQPALKKAHFDGELAAKKITQDQHEILMEDSDLKNAYTWYSTAVELFQPPRSQWVIKCEERLKEVKPKYAEWAKSMGAEVVE